MFILYNERLAQHKIFDTQEPLTPTAPCKTLTALLRQELRMSKNITKKISKKS